MHNCAQVALKKDAGELSDVKREEWPERPLLALVLYVLGLLLMLAVAAIMLWPQLELLFFDRPLIVEERMPAGALRCPLAVTRHEDATLAVSFTNERDRDERFRARARISQLSARLVDDFDQWVELAPGQSTEVRWSLDPESAAFGRMILARVHVSRRGSIAPQQRACGMMLLALPLFTGTQYVLGMALGGLLLLAASAFLWAGGRTPAEMWQDVAIRRRALLAGTVAAAMVAGILYLWVAAAFLLLLAAILLISFAH